MHSSRVCRILIFHTGRLVGTGAGGAMAARTSILKTLIQLRDEADIHLELVDFVIINQARETLQSLLLAGVCVCSEWT